MKTSKHKTPIKQKPASIAKHASIIGKLGGRPKKEVRLTDSPGRQAPTS